MPLVAQGKYNTIVLTLDYCKKVLNKGLKEIGHVNNIISIRCKCHTKIGNLKATCLKSDEPIKFQDLDYSKFVPILKYQKWAKKYGIPEKVAHPHSLRHLFAKEFIKRFGIEIQEV